MQLGPGQYRRAEAEELYKTGARGRGCSRRCGRGCSRRMRQRRSRGRKEEEGGGRRSRRIKSENHSQRFGKNFWESTPEKYQQLMARSLKKHA